MEGHAERLACLLLKLILDSICSLLCGALAGRQPGELKAPVTKLAFTRCGEEEEEAAGAGRGCGDAQSCLVPSLPVGMLQHPEAS